jgi:hypothetical protein
MEHVPSDNLIRQDTMRMQVSTQALTLLGLFLSFSSFLEALDQRLVSISLLGDIKTKD